MKDVTPVVIRGELHCYNCGYAAARVEGDRDARGVKIRVLSPLAGPGPRLRPGAAPRCGRCGGRLYLDEIDVVRPDSGLVAPLDELRALLASRRRDGGNSPSSQSGSPA
jgi:hypothetical protein